MWIDGGLATTLQAQGLPPHRPVEPWVRRHPERVEAAHRAFVEAGAEILLTATFRAMPGACPDWREVVPAAVELARRAADGRAAVWLTLGPPPPDHLGADLQALEVGLEAGVDGVVLETRVAPEATVAAVASARRTWSGPLVASLVPAADGRLLRGDEPTTWLAPLRDAGADGVGFNCGGGPEAVLRAVERCPPDSVAWAKPAGGGAEATVAALVALSARVRWCGGCCGVSPDLLARAVADERS